MTKTTKKVVKKTAKKTMKKNVIKTFYGVLHKAELQYIDHREDYEVMLGNCKSDHMNHSINSRIMHSKDEDMSNLLLVKVEILGQPLVKTTREITIKK